MVPHFVQNSTWQKTKNYEKLQNIGYLCDKSGGKKSFTYEEVKKIFRAIALSQKDIDPSTININANIKTKMPIFYDDDDDDD